MRSRFVLLAVCTASAGPAGAAYIYTGVSSSIVENFDGLPSTTQAGFLPGTVGPQVVVTGTGFDAAKIGGPGTGTTPLIADNGGSAVGGIYSYGATAAPERALGSLGDLPTVAGFGFQLINDISSGQTITEVTVAFTQESWRTGNSQNLAFAGVGTTDSGVSPADYISSDTGITPAIGITLVSPVPVTPNGPLDGNLPANQTLRTQTFTGLSIQPGESFFVRWQDSDNTASDAGLAIDGLTITITIPEPSAALLASGLGLLALRRRR